MFTQKQFETLHHKANNIRLANCSIRESVVTVSGIEQIYGSNAMIATIIAEDVPPEGRRTIFSTHATITIGPRGGIKFYREKHYVD